MLDIENNSSLEIYGNYALEALINKYKILILNLKKSDEDFSKVLDLKLFDDNREVILFKYILDTNYQKQFFITFQKEFCNRYKKALTTLIGLEDISIILDDEEEFYNFVIYFENKPLFIIFPYTKYVERVPDNIKDEIIINMQNAQEKLSILNKEINYLKDCINNPTLYSLDSNKNFAKVIFNKKGVKAKIQAELDYKIEEVQQVKNTIYNIEDYFKNNKYNELKEKSIIEKLESRLKNHNFILEPKSQMEENIEEEIVSDDIESYESLLNNNEIIFDSYTEI